jgi:uncharacterized membrane protein YfcA
MTFIILITLLLTGYCIYKMLTKLKNQPQTALSTSEKMKLGGTGIVAFAADTIGVGSFAVNIALSKCLKTFSDAELPAVCNGAQVIPGTLASLFFLHMIPVDLTTLITLVLGACIGGILGGRVVVQLSQQKIRLAMVLAFISVIILLILKQLGLIPQDGTLTALSGWKLIIGFFATIICGSLTSVGIGLFGMVQAVLFILGVSPAIAFPIMTTAGAMQQPLTTLVFLKHDKIPLKKTLYLSLVGCTGMLIGIPIISHMSTHWLHNLLLLIMAYNIITIGSTYWRKKKAISQVLEPGPAEYAHHD